MRSISWKQIIILLSLVTAVVACSITPFREEGQRHDTQRHREFTIIYTGGVLGEVEPCG
jgi:hypothetical protein